MKVATKADETAYSRAGELVDASVVPSVVLGVDLWGRLRAGEKDSLWAPARRVWKSAVSSGDAWAVLKVGKRAAPRAVSWVASLAALLDSWVEKWAVLSADVKAGLRAGL